MGTTLETTMRTMSLVAEAKSHFDASVRGPVTYSPEPVTNMSADAVWQDGISRMGWSMTDQGKNSRYGDDPRFSPLWFSNLTDEDHANIVTFINSHRESFWAIEGLFESLLQQCLNSKSDYGFLLRNFLLLWDSTNSNVIESEDCYSYSAIKGTGSVDVANLPKEEQERYHSLAIFAVKSYLAGLDGNDGDPNVVQEDIWPMRYIVQEPYRSMVLDYPSHYMFILDFLSRGYTDGDEEKLAELLAQNTQPLLTVGML